MRAPSPFGGRATSAVSHGGASGSATAEQPCNRKASSDLREPFYGVVEPRTHTVYVNDLGKIAAMGALLDALITQDVWSHAEDG